MMRLPARRLALLLGGLRQLTTGGPVLVTGGSGFLASHLVQQLADAGETVTVFDTRPSSYPGVKSVLGDVRRAGEVESLIRQIKPVTVFHCISAAPNARNASNEKLMNDVNVGGTRNMLDACTGPGTSVRRFLYTSSASVVFTGADLNGCDEHEPLPLKTLDFYTESKKNAELMVRAANGVGGVATVALRPAAIFGEGDTLSMPNIIQKAQQGRMMIVGHGNNKMDWVYAGNVAHAHILASRSLTLGSKLAGSTYNVTNQDARLFSEFVGDVLANLGYDRPTRKIPFSIVYGLAAACELVVAVASLHPAMLARVPIDVLELTRPRILFSAREWRVSSDRATRDWGYKPIVPLDEAIRRTCDHYRAQGLAKGGGVIL